MQTTLDVRDGYLCVMLSLRGARTKNSRRSSVRQWYPIREASAAEASVLNGRPVSCTDRDAGLYIDEEGTSYRLASGGQSKPLYTEIVPVEGTPREQLEAGTNRALIRGRETPRKRKRIAGNGTTVPQETGRTRRHYGRVASR
jgi:hypothetical protein